MSTARSAGRGPITERFNFDGGARVPHHLRPAEGLSGGGGAHLRDRPARSDRAVPSAAGAQRDAARHAGAGGGQRERPAAEREPGESDHDAVDVYGGPRQPLGPAHGDGRAPRVHAGAGDGAVDRPDAGVRAEPPALAEGRDDRHRPAGRAESTSTTRSRAGGRVRGSSTASRWPSIRKTDLLVPRKVRAVKKGYQPEEVLVSWEDSKTLYDVKLKPLAKQVKVMTEPPGATVLVEGRGSCRGMRQALRSRRSPSRCCERWRGDQAYTGRRLLKDGEREFEAHAVPDCVAGGTAGVQG